MKISKLAREWLVYFSNHPHVRINTRSLVERGLSRRKSQSVIRELLEAGYLKSRKNSRIGTKLELDTTTLVSSDIAVYSHTGSSYISNSEIAPAVFLYKQVSKYLSDGVGPKGETMGWDIFKPTSDPKAEMLEERRKFEERKKAEYQEERSKKQAERRVHRSKVPTDLWKSQDVAHEFADRLMDFWDIPPFRVINSRFVPALAQMRKTLDTNGTIELVMMELFFGSIQHDKYNDAEHLWRAFIKMAPSFVEQARRSVVTPEEAVTNKIDAEVQADKKLSRFEEE